MRKLILIIVLFFSTNVLADLWEERPLDFNLSFYVKMGWEIKDITKDELKGNNHQYTYFLSHPEGGFRICQILFISHQPEMTMCFKEKQH
tara:strand:- start:115 stop:384 length:270 start_codon:yes stop_codon:yes gene_type:complete